MLSFAVFSIIAAAVALPLLLSRLAPPLPRDNHRRSRRSLAHMVQHGSNSAPLYRRVQGGGAAARREEGVAADGAMHEG